MVLHTGDDPESGGIQRVCFDGLEALRSRSLLGPVLGPQGGTVKWAGAYLKAGWRWRGGTLLFHAGLAKLFWFRQPASPRVIFLHGIEIWKPFSWFHRRALLGTTKFLINSQFTWDRFKQWHPDLGRIPHEVVHLGIQEPTPYQPPDSQVPAALVISRLSREEDYKGHRELIGCWSRVRAVLPEAELWIAGDGNLRSDLEELARGVEGIRFWGRVSVAQKEELLRRCRCLAMPSRAEGFGLVYTEAMRLGRPCLVSDEDAGREVVNPPEAGIAVKQNDLEAMAQSLVFLLGDSEERRDMGHRAKARYDGRFTRGHFQERFLRALPGA